jgi:Sulfotransferase family
MGIPDLTDHFLNRAIVIEPARVLFVPIPKSACSSIMWALAEVAGIPAEHFERSISRETTAAMTVHDMKLWGPENRLIERTDDDLARLLTEEGWLRFTVVRDPVPRLWSAWQSKVLAREPQMLRFFGDAAWLPRQPLSPIEIVEHYRRFVAALGEATTDDPLPSLDPVMFNSHWAPQTALLGETGLASLQVTRLADLPETLGMLMKHLADLGFAEPTVPTLNRSILPFSNALNGPSEMDTIRKLYRADFEAFGFEAPHDYQPDGLGEWESNVRHLLEPLRSITERNERIEILATESTTNTYRLNRAEVRLQNSRRTLYRRAAALDSAEQANRRLRERLNSTAATQQAMQEKLRRVDEALSIARSNLGFAQSTAADAFHRVAEVERRIDEMERSLTWRLAAPFRRLRAILRRGPAGSKDGS